MSTPMNIPPDLPPEVIPVLVEMGYLEADRLQPGDTAPQLALECPGTGDSALVGGQHNSQPTVLIFGSYTWPPFRRQAVRLEEIYQSYSTLAQFYVVYIREAHPEDGWQMDSNRAEGVIYEQHRSIEARQSAASACAVGLNLTIPTLIDSMDNAADRAYQGWPERLYVLSADGRVAYQGGKGPYGFDLEELASFLSNQLCRGE